MAVKKRKPKLNLILDDEDDYEVLPIPSKYQKAWHHEGLYSIKIRYRDKIYWKCQVGDCTRVSPDDSRRCFGAHFFDDHDVPLLNATERIPYFQAPPLLLEYRKLELLIKPESGLLEFLFQSNKPTHNITPFEINQHKNGKDNTVLSQLNPALELDLDIECLYNQQNIALKSILDNLPVLSLACYSSTTDRFDTFLSINVCLPLAVFTSKIVSIGLVKVPGGLLQNCAQDFVNVLELFGIGDRVYTITVDNIVDFQPLAETYKNLKPDSLFQIENLFPCIGGFIFNSIQKLVDSLSFNLEGLALDRLRDGKEYIKSQSISSEMPILDREELRDIHYLTLSDKDGTWLDTLSMINVFKTNPSLYNNYCHCMGASFYINQATEDYIFLIDLTTVLTQLKDKCLGFKEALYPTFETGSKQLIIIIKTIRYLIGNISNKSLKEKLLALSTSIATQLQGLVQVHSYQAAMGFNPHFVKISHQSNKFWFQGFGSSGPLDEMPGLPLKTKPFGLVKKVWALFLDTDSEPEEQDTCDLDNYGVSSKVDELDGYLQSSMAGSNFDNPNYLPDYWSKIDASSRLVPLAAFMINLPAFSQPYYEFMGSKFKLSCFTKEGPKMFAIRTLLTICYQQQFYLLDQYKTD